MIYSAITLKKYVQSLYGKNHKTLMKEIKENLNKWEDIFCSCIRRFVIAKTSHLTMDP